MTTATRIDAGTALKALASHRTALVALKAVPALLGLDADEAFDVLADLEDAGLVESYADDDAPAVILSPLGALRAGVELRPTTGRANPLKARWLPIGKGKPARTTTDALVVLESDLGWDGGSLLDALVDPTAREPWFLVASGEAGPPAPKRGRRTPPTALPIVYGCGIAWPAIVGPDGHCPGCGGRWRRSHAVCLICQRAADLDGPDARPVKDRHAGGRRKYKPTPARKPRAASSPLLDGKAKGKPRGFTMRAPR